LPNTTHYSRDCDLVIFVGPLLSDTNTARWSALPEAVAIQIDMDKVWIPTMTKETRDAHPGLLDKSFSPVRGEDVLNALLSRIEANPSKYKRPLVKDNHLTPPKRASPIASQRITQDDFWPAMSAYVKPEDTLLLANGTPLIGGRAIKLQSGCQVVASSIWNAIGSMLPAAQGIAAAKRDHQLPGRTILFEGDGSFQVTCQALSDIIRYKLDVTIFIINNAGYTYERYLHGMNAEYNDVPAWRYVEMAKAFGARDDDPTYPIYSKRIETWGGVVEVLEDPKANDGKGLKIIDVVMDPKDVPEASKPGLQKASEALRLRMPR
jgi:pyruvate decarboxylase